MSPTDLCKKCGHERAEHYEKQHNCMRACDCERFYDKPPPLPARPNHARWCQCYRCKQHATPPRARVEPDEIDEDPPPTPAPSTQRIWPRIGP